MFTATQAANDGIDANTLRRLSAENLIYRLRRGVYIHAAVAETPHTDLAAAWLAARPAISALDRFVECDPVAASHESAAYAWGLGDVIPAKHTFTCSVRKQTSASDVSWVISSALVGSSRSRIFGS